MAQGGRQRLTRRTIHAGSILGTLICITFWLFTISSGTGCESLGNLIASAIVLMVTGFLYKLVFILLMKIGYLTFGLTK